MEEEACEGRGSSGVLACKSTERVAAADRDQLSARVPPGRRSLSVRFHFPRASIAQLKNA